MSKLEKTMRQHSHDAIQAREVVAEHFTERAQQLEAADPRPDPPAPAGINRGAAQFVVGPAG